jgi:hypothetical protein
LIYFIFIRGYNIGQRLIDEYFSKVDGKLCQNYKEMAESIAIVMRKKKIYFFKEIILYFI